MLVQLAIIQISLALCFAVITFFFEQEHSKGQFQTMVDSIWYALITMYTIGFGDQVRFSYSRVSYLPLRSPKLFSVAVLAHFALF